MSVVDFIESSVVFVLRQRNIVPSADVFWLVDNKILTREETEGYNVNGPLCSINNRLIHYEQNPATITLKIKAPADKQANYEEKIRRLLGTDVEVDALGINFSYFVAPTYEMKNEKIAQIFLKDNAFLAEKVKNTREFSSHYRIPYDEEITLGIDLLLAEKHDLERSRDINGIYLILNYDHRRGTKKQTDLLCCAKKYDSFKQYSDSFVDGIKKDMEDVCH